MNTCLKLTSNTVFLFSVIPRLKSHFSEFNITDSLDVRVAIAAGIQILGYKSFWIYIFVAFNLDKDDNSLNILEQRDVVKTNKTITEKSKEGKMRKSDLKYKKSQNCNRRRWTAIVLD